MTAKSRLALTPTIAAISMLFVGVLFLGACTSDDPEPAALPFDDTPSRTEEGTLGGGDPGVDGSEVVGLEGVEEVWLAAGADPELAECYRAVFEEAGLGDNVASLQDMAVLQDSLNDEQQAAFDSCVDHAN